MPPSPMNAPRRSTRDRKGLRIIGSRGNPEVAGALVRYARWLRQRYEFPVRVPAYLSHLSRIVTIEGEIVSASFVYPFDEREYPHIRIATGDYPELLTESGRNNALAAYLCSLSHELVHYWQWLETGAITERGVAVRAANMVRKYALDVDAP